ncbi:cold shock domain-containing protein [Colwellia ponticola]|uniref:cold shock domain-containing protein n=1 Tax=Colwellia ponticola TaxID=2304625 RepID=UPI00267DA862
MQLKGKLIKWNQAKAFGFIAPNGGGDHVFIHKNVFSNRSRSPKINDGVTFLISKERQSRYCADDATFTCEKIKKEQVKKISKFSIYLSVSFFVLMTSAYFLDHIPQKLIVDYFGISVITFLAYAFDKSKVQRAAWLIPESDYIYFHSLVDGLEQSLHNSFLGTNLKKSIRRQLTWLTGQVS